MILACVDKDAQISGVGVCASLFRGLSSAMPLCAEGLKAPLSVDVIPHRTFTHTCRQVCDHMW